MIDIIKKLYIYYDSYQWIENKIKRIKIIKSQKANFKFSKRIKTDIHTDKVFNYKFI